jgi:hypothetical protein
MSAGPVQDLNRASYCSEIVSGLLLMIFEAQAAAENQSK